MTGSIQAVHHFSLTVRDLDASVRWYRDVFGLQEVMDETHEGGHAVVLVQPGTQIYVGLHHHDANAGEPFSETRTGLDHLALAVGDRRDLEQWAARFAALGVTCSPIVDVSYGSILPFRDPDNIQMELIAPPAA